MDTTPVRGPPHTRKHHAHTLTTTWHHPFWDAGHHRWTDAHDLTPGTRLRQPDGTTVLVSAVHNFHQHRTTYDLTVGNLHTYYVLAGATPVLVHNSNGCPTGRLSDPLPRGMNNKIASAYDDVRAGRIPSHDTYSGREHPWWAGSKEYRVPGRPETDRILEKELPNGSRCTVGHPRITRRFNASAHPTSLTRGGISSLIR
ncbi:polymorphic toxin-type HINT domain-containing protein [Streptomyces sp. AF1A]|uniref:polymorphic toxin-type HINT domain-containing protein n=1 Tax=Streptomyces sp. AF1A TaxID=3394350 RepID=UPI0039BC9BFD